MSSPQSNPEPEKYSLDEMMERLKGRSTQEPGEGELVTRADGSQAVRLRKRKRRSGQPRREEFKRRRRIRATQVGLLVGGLLLLVLLIGGAFIYSNTAPYRKRLSDAFSRSLGADIEFKGFRVTPVSANADAVALDWHHGGFLKSVRLRQITSKISPRTLLGRSITGEAVFAREGEILLQAPTAGAAPANPEAAADGPPISFDRAGVTKLSIIFGEPLDPMLRIAGAECTLTTSESKLSKTVNLHRGTLTLREWPAMKLERALLEMSPEQIELVNFRVSDSMTPRGEMNLSGSINTLSPETRSKLAVTLNTFNFADLIGPELGNLLNLRIDTVKTPGSSHLTFTAANPGEAELEVNFTNALSSSNSMTGFKFLNLLARALDDSYYDKPEFDEAAGTIRRKGGQIDITGLHLERKTLLCIKGDLSVGSDGILSGVLKVGIPESIIHLSLNAKLETMFSKASGGFRWLTLTLSGPLARPADDFAQIYNQTTPPPRPDTPATLDDPTPPAATDPDPTAPDAVDPADPGKVFEELTAPR